MNRSFLAPAKVNLCLHVLGRRPDGYHELAMLMQRISLCDRITLEVKPAAETQVVCRGMELPPGEENIAARAARSLLARAGLARQVTIEIEKRIPVAAGLGGGSSDAATVLTGLDAMLGLGLERETLLDLGRRLGADVPFFVGQQSAWATGIGERLDPVPPLPRLWYLLVNPGIAVSTAWVYGNLRLTTPGDVNKLRKFPGTLEEVVRLLHNDLERVTIPRHPVIATIKDRMLDLGAAGTLMSGSGPTVFGVFAAAEQARAACRELAGEPDWRVFLAEPLADGPVPVPG